MLSCDLQVAYKETAFGESLNTDNPNAAHILMHHTNHRNSNLTSVIGPRKDLQNEKETKIRVSK